MKKALQTISLVGASTLVFVSQAFAQVNIQLGNGSGISTAGAASTAGSSILGLLALAQTIVARLVPFFIGVAVVVFFWYLIVFITKGNQDGAKHDQALKGMGMSILALFVMVSIWGIVGFMSSFLGVGVGGSVPVPGIPIPG